jgi:hypothetical protein
MFLIHSDQPTLLGSKFLFWVKFCYAHATIGMFLSVTPFMGGPLNIAWGRPFGTVGPSNVGGYVRD